MPRQRRKERQISGAAQNLRRLFSLSAASEAAQARVLESVLEESASNGFPVVREGLKDHHFRLIPFVPANFF